MGIKSIKQRTLYSYEDDEGNVFDIPWEVLESTIILEISEDGLTAKLGSLSQDEDCGDPFEGDEGEFYQFNCRYIHYTEKPEIDAFKRIIRENPGRVFTHSGTDDNHGPGTCSCFVEEGPFSVKDTKGDKRTGDNSPAEKALDKADGYYIAPEDVTDATKYAKSVLSDYTSWCNGDVYGVCVWKYEREDKTDSWGEPDRDEECWGYIGYDYAREELEAQMKGA